MFSKKKKNKKFSSGGISPDEVFLDSQNISGFDYQQLEGRMEKPIEISLFLFVGSLFLIAGLILLGRAGYLQVEKGDTFAERAQNNHLRVSSIFADRGLIFDRNGELLAWNDPEGRSYKDASGLAHVLGFLGVYSEDMVGKAGVEKSFEEVLKGEKGRKVTETDSLNNIKSESVQTFPVAGSNIQLTIDSRVQNRLYEIFSEITGDRGFEGAAGVVVDVHSGDILALVSYPEYSSRVLTRGTPAEVINEFQNDPRKPFLNRAISGLYAPGSIVKPFMAMGALNEGVISPEKEIFSSGSISIPNPYFPDLKSVFYDWKAHGWVNMKRALAVSSNVYFYTIGGGYENMAGLGINKINEYMNLFGLGKKTGIVIDGESKGVVPSPELKEDIWRIGDTYNASIGQGDFQVTPIQMAVATAAIANGGTRWQPNLEFGREPTILSNIEIPLKDFNIVRSGMRMAVVEGTAKGLGGLPVKIAAKTGTAELGMEKSSVNSWIEGFWPYEDPRFAFSIVFEKGDPHNLIGGVYAARQLIEWMLIHTPEYLHN
jgi:penicillin-binding protein 2